MSEPMLKKARTIQEVLSQSEEARALYELRFKALHDREAREGRMKRLEAKLSEKEAELSKTEAELSERKAALSEKERQVQQLLEDRQHMMQALLTARFGADAERLFPRVAEAAARETAGQLWPKLMAVMRLEEAERLLMEG